MASYPTAARIALPLRPAPPVSRQPERSAPRTAAPGGRTGPVVRLELPEVDTDDRQSTQDHAGSDLARSSRPAEGGPGYLLRIAGDLDLDAERVARAVEELLKAVAPALAGQVRVERNSPSAAAAALSAPHSATADGLVLDPSARTLFVDGSPTTLTRREFELLAYLEARRGLALSRREIMDAVWNTGYLRGDRTIDVHVRRVRVKLGRHSRRLTTLRGFGYRFD
jgi:hypothetical protein